MNLTLDELREDLIARWKNAFERIDEMKAPIPKGYETVYTRYPAFALEKYTVKKFPPGARVSRTPSKDGGDYVFRLDEQGRPVHVQYRHEVNRVSWQGFYRYRPDEVESIEFCMQTGVPSLYNRLVLSGDSVLAEQRFLCNGGGASPHLTRLSTPGKIADVLKDPHGYFIYLTLYHVEDGVTKSAEEYQEVGDAIHRPTLEYSYATDGKLARIVQHWPDGETRTVFAPKTKTTTGDLAERLSAKIAADVLMRLGKAQFGAPLAALELTYREGDHHIPLVVPRTEKDEVESPACAAEIDPKRWITLNDEDFAPEITEFNQRVEAAESPAAVAKMLRAAARRITEGAPKQLAVAKNFVAYAIDWELEGDEIAKILKQCGATPELLRDWKKRGWL